MMEISMCCKMERLGEQETKAQNVTPWWLKRLDVVRAELRGTAFPRTAEEGLRQCAELSAVSMELFKAELGKTCRKGGEERLDRGVRRLMDRFSKTEARWKSTRKGNSATAEGK
jgi:hypothetical protein